MIEYDPLCEEQKALGSFDIDNTSMSVELGDAEFERILSKRAKYGLTEGKKRWNWSMLIIQCILCFVVSALVVIVVYQLIQPAGLQKHLKKSEAPIHEKRLSNPHLSPRRTKQLEKLKALRHTREKAQKKLHPLLRKHRDETAEKNMEPRLKAKLSQWKKGQLTEGEKMGRTSKSLLNFRKQPLPEKVPHHIFSAAPPDIRGRNKPLRSMGLIPHGHNSATTSSSGRSVDPLGKDSRLNNFRNPRAQQILQALANRKNHNSMTSLMKGRKSALSQNLRPPLKSSVLRHNSRTSTVDGRTSPRGHKLRPALKSSVSRQNPRISTAGRNQDPITTKYKNRGKRPVSTRFGRSSRSGIGRRIIL